jgi:hypothetical protein
MSAEIPSRSTKADEANLTDRADVLGLEAL